MASIKQVQHQIGDWAEKKGWNDPDIVDPCAPASQLERRLAAIALIHLKVSEDLEKLRKGEEIEPEMLAEIDDVALDAFGPTDEDGNHPAGPGEEYDINQVKVLAKLALVHSEISEGVECVLFDVQSATRMGDGAKPEGLHTELADAHIRLFHLEHMIGSDAEQELQLKMVYNETRPHKHGKLA